MIIVTERFTALAKAVYTGKGVPNLPHVVLPLNPEFYPPGRLEKEVDIILEKIVAFLTMPQGKGA